jgi:uncharacterized protein involved in exopolysaccharide biosynthesis
MIRDSCESLPLAPRRSESEPDLRVQVRRALALVRRALRFWYVLVATLLLGGASCIAFFRLQPPSYRSETAILHTDGIAVGDPVEQATTPRNVAARVQEILMSRQQLGRVLQEFDLYPEVQRAYGPVDAVDELKKHVQFKAPGGNTFRISFDGDSPEQAQRVTARLAELVVDEDSALRKAQARVTQDFMAAEKKDTEGQLRDTEYELASFMAAHPRFALDTTPLTTGAAIRANVQGTPPPTTPRWNAAPPARGAGPAPGGAPAPAPAPSQPTEAAREALREQASAAASLAAARANLVEKLAHFTPAHPDVRAAQAAVAMAEARLVAATEGLPADPVLPPVGPHDTNAPATRATPSRWVPTPDARPGSPARPDLVALEIEWATLTRNVIEARQHHDQVEAALFKANIAASSVNGDNHGTQMTVIDPAFLPQRPLPPERSLIAAIAGAMSLFLGVMIALVCAALGDRIYVRRDLATVAHVLVEVPYARKRRRVHVSK